LDAVIRGEADLDGALDVVMREDGVHRGVVRRTVVSKARVAVNRPVVALADDIIIFLGREAGSKTSVLAANDAVRWPKSLVHRDATVGDFNNVKFFVRRMLRVEGGVVLRMPILSCDDEIELADLDDFADDGDDGQRVGDRKSSGGQETVLGIDDDESSTRLLLLLVGVGADDREDSNKERSNGGFPEHVEGWKRRKEGEEENVRGNTA